MPELIEHGKILRPTLGIEMAPERYLARYGVEGILVTNVVQGSAAEKAGIIPMMRDRRGRIQLGDIIVGIDNNLIKNRNGLRLALENYKPGDEVTIKVIRGEESLDLPLVLDEAR